MVPESYETMGKATPRRPVERSPWFILFVAAVFLAGYGLVMGTGPSSDDPPANRSAEASDTVEGAVGLDSALEASPRASRPAAVPTPITAPSAATQPTPPSAHPAANLWTTAASGVENAVWLSPPTVVRTDMTGASIPRGERILCGLSPQGSSSVDRSTWYWVEIANPGTLTVGQYGVEGATFTAVWGPFTGLPSSVETQRPRWCVSGNGVATLSEPIDVGVWLLQLTTSADRELSPILAVSFAASAVGSPPPVTVIVVSGDTFGEIAGRYGLSVEALAAANPQIADPSLIHPGDRIIVPSGGPDRRPEGTHDLSPDPAACSAVGWTRDPDDPSRVLAVRVLVDGTVRASVLADGYRADLADWFHDTGLYAFDIDLRHLLTPGDEHEIRVQARDAETGDWSDLNETPRLLTCT